jgi:hypothetical protein
MKVNGYILREAIKKLHLQIEIHENQFDNNTMAFADDKKKALEAITADWFEAEEKICSLQEALNAYNLKVKIEVDGLGAMSLAKAIKLVGPASRIEKRWRQLAAPKKDRYERHRPDLQVKEDGTKYAEKTYTVDAAMFAAISWGKRAAGIRGALAVGNSTLIDLDIPGALFE